MSVERKTNVAFRTIYRLIGRWKFPIDRGGRVQTDPQDARNPLALPEGSSKPKEGHKRSSFGRRVSK